MFKKFFCAWENSNHKPFPLYWSLTSNFASLLKSLKGIVLIVFPLSALTNSNQLEHCSLYIGSERSNWGITYVIFRVSWNPCCIASRLFIPLISGFVIFRVYGYFVTWLLMRENVLVFSVVVLVITLFEHPAITIVVSSAVIMKIFFMLHGEKK